MNKVQTSFSVAGVNPHSRLQMVLLGPPQMVLEGQDLHFRTRKAMALLIYLALEPGLHTKDKLCALLWPQADETQGRASLRGAITHLNRVLGASLISRRDTLGLDTSKPLELDVNILEAAFKHAGHHNQEDNLEAILQGAANLYRGEFLEGFNLLDAPEFDDWVVARRELARQWLDTVLEHLSEIQAESGRVQLALETALRRVKLEPLNEAAHQQLIALHLKLGNRGAALEAYQFCKNTLETELGLAPSPQTDALLTRLIDAPKATTVYPPPDHSSSIAPLPQQIRLIGRAEPLASIEAAWNKGQGIFVSGEAGIGKTRLIQEFLASKSGAVVYRSARPGEANVPYASLAENLRKILLRIPDLKLEPWVGSELSRILPELGEAGQPAMAHEADKLRFFNAVAQTMQRGFTYLSAMVMDDLQFYDEASLEVVAYLNSKFAEADDDTPTRLINLYRPSEASAVLLKGMQSLLEREAAVLIELGALAPHDVSQMLADLIPDNANPDSLGLTLHRFTGGNPMFVLETVRSLAQRGSLETLTAERFEARRRVAGLPRSPKVTAVINRRLERLSTPAKDLSRVAAILGEQFTQERAAMVLNTNLLALAPLAEELEAAHVWHGLHFSHDLLYEAVLENMPASLKPILHSQVLDVLEGEAGAAVLAHHALAAGRSEAAVRHSLQAGLEAFALRALPEAVEHLERVRTMANASPAFWNLLSEQERYTLYDTLLKCFNDDGLHQPEHKKPLEAEMIEFGCSVTDPEISRKVELRVAYEHIYRTWDHQPLQHLLQKRLGHLRQNGDPLQVYETLIELDRVAFQQDDFATALSFASEALELARKLGDATRIGQCLIGVGVQHFGLGQWSQADTVWAESAQYLSPNDRLGWTEMRGHRAINWLYLGRPKEALDELRVCLQTWQELHSYSAEVIARFRISMALLELGEYGGAQAAMNQNQRQFRPSAFGDFVSPYKSLVEYKLGQLGAAHTTLMARTKYSGLGATHHLCQRSSLFAGIHAMKGDWPKACHYAIEAFEVRHSFRLQRHYAGIFMPRHLETEALLRGGQEELARENLRRLDEASQGYKRLSVSYLQSRSVLEAWEGRTAEAIAVLWQAKALALEIGLPGELWEIEAKLAELLELQGQAEQALQVRASALRGIQNLANRIDDPELKQGFVEFAQKQVIRETEKPRSR